MEFTIGEHEFLSSQLQRFCAVQRARVARGLDGEEFKIKLRDGRELFGCSTQLLLSTNLLLASQVSNPQGKFIFRFTRKTLKLLHKLAQMSFLLTVQQRDEYQRRVNTGKMTEEKAKPYIEQCECKLAMLTLLNKKLEKGL